MCLKQNMPNEEIPMLGKNSYVQKILFLKQPLGLDSQPDFSSPGGGSRITTKLWYCIPAKSVVSVGLLMDAAFHGGSKGGMYDSVILLYIE